MSRFFSPKYLRYSGGAAAGPIDDDRPCDQCGYNVRGLRFGGVCPECGSTILRHESARDSLADAPLPEIHTLRSGFWLVMASMPFVLLAPVMGVVIVMNGAVSTAVIMIAACSVWVAAVWRSLPALETGGAARRGLGGRSRLRRAARLMQIAWPLAFLFVLYSLVGPIATQWTVHAIQGIGGLLIVIGTAGVAVLAIMYSRIADWCANEFAVKQYDWALWGMSVSVVGLALGLVFPLVRGFACMFVVWWVLAWLCFLAGTVSLSRAVTWSARHSRERAQRDRRLRERMQRVP